MGIDNFHSLLKQKYKDCFLEVHKKMRYDHIYFDINHILHHVIYIAKNENDFKHKLFYSLDHFLNKFFVLHSVTFAVDGPSPYSKIKLQRKRRMLHKADEDFTKLNSIYLTPGTKFMSNVTLFLNEYIEKRKRKYKYRNVKFIIFDTSLPDEGEIKLLKTLKENGKNFNHTHLVVGNDADLVVICMSASPIYNIDICIKVKGTFNIVSIKKLILSHYQKYEKNIRVPKTIDNLKNNSFRYDFNMISIMMGNDYIPKLQYVKTNVLWESYDYTKNKLNCNLLNNKLEINYDFMIHMLRKIVSQVAKQFKFFTLESYSEENCKNYIEGLLWCVNMYSTGKCSAYDYEYNGKKAPSPTELQFFFESEKRNIKVPINDSKPISHDVYPLLVMPKKAKNLINYKFHHAMDNQLKYLYLEEESPKCNELKTKLSNLHKKMYLLRKENKIEELEIIKSQISDYSKKLLNEKKKYEFTFDINKILNQINHPL
ncbi:MAG: hypothetical protein CMF62_03355 [Magnetococcales bacterium]|nr:hypothetical protein [Magnetococcales bacterium]|tara:strand:- start:14560 stop:16011 length:1452 start_codon:yes stop_codon:yes gene_type:complete